MSSSENNINKSNLIGLFFKFSIGNWFSAALSFFTTPIITALIIPEEFGKASMFTLAFNFVLQIVLLGTDQSFVRKFYSEEFRGFKHKLLFNSILIPILFGLLVFIPLLFFWKEVSELLIEEYDFLIVVLLGVAIMAGIFERYALLFIRMKKNAAAYSILKIIGSIVAFVSLLLYAKFVENSFYAIVISTIAPLFVTASVAIALEFNEWFHSFKFDKKLIASLIKYGLPFLPTFMISWVFEGIDKMALRHYSTFSEIGLFSAAFKIVALLSILQAAFSTFWTPIAYEVYELRSEKAKELFSKSLAYISAVLFISGIGIFLFKELIILLFASNYREAVHIMPFLLFIPIMYTLSEITVGGINFTNKTYWHLVISGVCAIANICLNFYFVPKLGAKGAALSTGISYVIFFYARTLISNRVFPINFGLLRLSVATGLFFSIALVNTFATNYLFLLLGNLISIIIMIYIYIKELIYFYSVGKEKLRNINVKAIA